MAGNKPDTEWKGCGHPELSTYIIWNGHLVGTSLGRSIHPCEGEKIVTQQRGEVEQTEALHFVYNLHL